MNIKRSTYISGSVFITVLLCFVFPCNIQGQSKASAPGGITNGLRLWLRADDEASLTIKKLSVNDPMLTGYPDANGATVLPAVSVWNDIARRQNYSYDAGPTSGTDGKKHLIPVLKKYCLEMNYHPAVHFYGDGVRNCAYLTNKSTGIMPWSTPPDGKHTAYFVVNNNFSRCAWFYTLSFGAAQKGDVSGMPKPGYGVEHYKKEGNIVGRFRADADVTRGSANLFTPGATSILGYQTRSANKQKTNYAYFSFNGKEDDSSTAPANGDKAFDWKKVNFATPSTLGAGYKEDRAIQGVMSEVVLYDRQLSNGEVQELESYFALKYGVTLRPSSTRTHRFDYKLSNGTVIWMGNTNNSRFADFYNNVAAVIRDDAALLNNRHSHSTDVGSLLHMGVAGKRLSDDGSEAGTLNDKEAVVFGSDNATGNIHIAGVNGCGDFTDRFRRKWLVHKVTREERPVTMLIGAQNNAGSIIGNDPNVRDYYNKLTSGYDVYLIIADTPQAIDRGEYRAVIPMSLVNGEHQCSYTFSQEDTYITFGWKANGRGCVGDVMFTGTKRFDWSQWTSQTNTSSAAGLTLTVNTPVNLGNNIQVTNTSVKYPAGVRATSGYPRSVNKPVQGSLQVRRAGGVVDQEIEISVNFNHPVIPEFSISGLDCRSSSYDEVEIIGKCSGSIYVPTLSFAGNPSRSGYRISGNRATVIKRGSVSADDKNGMVNVTFSGGVTNITIKYRLKSKTSSSVQDIYISPVIFRSVPPLPPVNEDGLSFIKQVKEHNITTCDPVEYTFHIQNTNCDPKTVDFTDVLPAGMKWKDSSAGLDAVSSTLNPSLNSNSYGDNNELKITGLIIPGASTLMLTATAMLDTNALGKDYANRASIGYEQIVNNNTVRQTLQSVDGETQEPNTVFTAVWQQRQDKVDIQAAYSRETYRANSEIDVIYTITNTNADITDMWLEVDFNEEFSYVPGSLQITQTGATVNPAPVLVSPDPLNSAPSINIAGSSDGAKGFTLPNGKMEIKFSLKAPALENIQDELDDEGIPTDKKADLDIVYSFSSGKNDPCLLAAIGELEGNKLIPYSSPRTHITTNKDITVKMVTKQK